MLGEHLKQVEGLVIKLEIPTCYVDCNVKKFENNLTRSPCLPLHIYYA